MAHDEQQAGRSRALQRVQRHGEQVFCQTVVVAVIGCVGDLDAEKRDKARIVSVCVSDYVFFRFDA